MAIQNPVTMCTTDVSGESNVVGNGNHIPISPTGPIVSQASLTLSASSQALPTPPSTANSALLQVNGGTVTDRVYISLDGTDATTSDFHMKNVEDTTANIGGPTELIVTGNLEDIRVLGTANASTMVIWWFE